MNERRMYLSEVPNNATEVTADNYTNLTFNVVYVPCFKDFYISDSTMLVLAFKAIYPDASASNKKYSFIELPSGEIMMGLPSSDATTPIGLIMLHKVKMNTGDVVSALTGKYNTPYYVTTPFTIKASDKTFLSIKYHNYESSSYSNESSARLFYGWMKLKIITSSTDKTLKLGKFQYFNSDRCPYSVYVDTE